MLKQLDVTYDVPDIEIEAAIRKYREKDRDGARRAPG